MTNKKHSQNANTKTATNNKIEGTRKVKQVAKIITNERLLERAFRLDEEIAFIDGAYFESSSELDILKEFGFE